MSNQIRSEVIRIEDGDYLAVYTDEMTIFFYEITYEGPVPSFGARLHPMSPIRDKAVAALNMRRSG